MAVRATKRGAEKTSLEGSYDAVVCGASFAGLAVARELAGSGRDVLLVDRYEVGERQTSACAIPTEWLEALGLEGSIKQTFTDLVVHRPAGISRRPARTHRWTLPWRFSTFDYRQLCLDLKAQSPDVPFDTAKVDGRTRLPDGSHVVHTDRGDLRAPLVVDALGWRRVLSAAPEPIQPPDARLSRGLEVHPAGERPDLELWLDPRRLRPGYGWSFPAGDEIRVGFGSFDPRVPVKGPTVELAEELEAALEGYQGNWIPHRLRAATEDGVFFAGDSAGHCLPATAEGIRPALHFGLVLGRELRLVLDGRQSREQATERYTARHEDLRPAFEAFFRVQQAVAWANPSRLMDLALEVVGRPSVTRRSFAKYLAILPPPPRHLPGDARAGGAPADLVAA